MKICEPKFKRLYSKTMQYECYRLFSNLRGLAKTKGKRKVGRLRFKSKSRFKTFVYNQSGFKLVMTGKRCQTLKLSKIGSIPIRCHRNIQGKIKQITVKCYSSGKWYASIMSELKVTVPKKQIRNVVGIDLGLNDVVYDSDGNKVENPCHLKKKAKKLMRLQRKLSKKRKGSSNGGNARVRLTKQYEKLVNSRNDFLHKLSNDYVRDYDCIGFEDFRITNMVKGMLAKSILDASWGKLRQFVAYKVERTGKHYVTVNYRGTSQRCSHCGETVAKNLAERVHKCPFCKLEIPRDYNSALEVKNLTLKELEIGQELSEYKPVEIPLSAELQEKVYESRIRETGSHILNTESVRL